jgi:hypothetical protein
MSDPVTNLGQGDLLSSLRRLVTDALAVPPVTAPVAAMPERLVLTPSFRVAPPVEPEVPTTATSLARTIQELEVALGVTPGEWEPDGSEVKSPAPDWSDLQPLAFRPAIVRPTPVVEPEPAPETTFQSSRTAAVADDDDADAELSAFLAEPDPATGESDTDDEGFAIDESALRALVADVLRQELQGELGERITRNVRKLVRREIHRVLNSEEMS